nr:MAG TPA: FN3 [Caudoviricetes sp.]
MAITWSGSSGYMRVGIDLSWSGTPDSGRVTVTAVYYLESDGYGHNWTSALHRWGEIAGDVPVSFYSPWGGTVRIEAARQRVTLPTAYGSSRTYGFGASLGPIWNGGAPSVAAYITVPARQWETPYAPTNVTATTSDGRTATVSWTQPIDAAHPVGASGVERWESGTASWVRVGTLQLTAHSWTDTSLKPGRGYWYRVWAWNGRESARISSNLIYSVPAAPTAVAAAKTAAGDIRVSWTPSGVYTHEAYEAFDVYDNDARVAAAVRASTWTHTAPSTATTHTYTIRARVPSGLISTPSAPSNTVQLLCRPGTPQPTGPAGAQTPGPITLTWLHASLDTTAQTSAQIRYRVADATDWTTATTTVEQSWTTPALAAGVWQWQVRTRGAWQADQEEGWSPWSAQQRLVVADLPVTEIVSPPSAVETSRINVTWSYFQAQSYRQVAAAVALAPVTLGVAGDPVESATVTGPDTTWAPSTSLADSTDWLLSVTVVSETGQRSVPATRLLHVAYPPPAVPVVEAVWDETTGTVGVGITNPAPLDPGLRRTNLLTDPRLRDPSAWTAAGAHLAAAGADGGLTLTPSGSDVELAWATTVSVEAGTWVGWAVDAAGPAGAMVAAVVRFESADAAEVAVVAGAASAGDGRRTVVAKAPAGAQAARVLLRITGAPLDGTVVRVDRGLILISTQEIAATDTTYFDGEGPNQTISGQSYAVSWTGAPFASTSVATPNSPITVRNRLERSVDGGVTWEEITADAPPDTSLSDPEALSAGVTLYRVEAYSPDGALAVGRATCAADSQAMWIGGGIDYRDTVGLFGDPDHTVKPGLVERKVLYFAGRRLGVEVCGPAQENPLSASARFLDEDYPTVGVGLERLARSAGPVCWRDPVGRRLYASLTDVSMARSHAGGVWDIDLDLKEVERD